MAKSIADYKNDYNTARGRGDAAGMQAANDGANAIRTASGQRTESASADIGRVSSGGGGGRSSSGYKEYTGLSSGNAAMDAQIDSLRSQYGDAKIAGDAAGMREANDRANQIRNQNGFAAQYATNDIWDIQNQYSHDDSGGGNVYTGQVVQPQSAGGLYAELLAENQRRYDEIQAQQEAAKRAAVEQAVGQLTGQKSGVDQQYSDLYRQLYLQRRTAEKNLPQQMAAMGYTGGLTESTAMGLQTSYADALRQGEQEKIGTLQGIDQAIADARLSGDISIAEQAAQTAKDRLASYGSIVGEMQQQQNWQAQFGRGVLESDRDYVRGSLESDRDFNRLTGLDQVSQGQYQDDRGDVEYNKKLSEAQYYYETTGDASLFAALNYSPEQIAAMHNAWVAAQQAAAAKTSKSSKSNGGSGTKTVSYTPSGGQDGGNTREEAIAQAAGTFFKQHPDIAVDSRTLDIYLEDMGISGAEQTLFKAYLESYGARHERNS